jgi:hypothetical protein
MSRRALGAVLALGLAAAPAAAQSAGAITGVVREAGPNGTPLVGARVAIDGGRTIVSTDGTGTYRLRELTPGWHSVTASAIGYRPVRRDSVLVRAGQTTALDFALTSSPVALGELEVIATRVDSVLDPLAVQDQQRYTAEDLRRLPVTTVDEAISLSAGVVAQSFRGGRAGQQAFILDGLGLKNQLDASTGSLGLRLPPDLLAEASLVTNGFSARYGQAVSAFVNLATRDGADRWGARLRYETDRPLGGGADLGTDRAVAVVEGPLPLGIRVIGVADLSGRLDADPVHARAPTNPHDPATEAPPLLPHNSAEAADLAAKAMVPLGGHRVLRLLGVHSGEQRLLFDPVYKYDQALAPARRTSGTLLSAHLQQTFATSPITIDARVGYFTREFVRGEATEPTDYRFGAFTGERLEILGEDFARRQDTVAARTPLPGFRTPTFSDVSPWGVPAFFMGSGSRGDLAWNRFRELRTRVDVSLPAGAASDFHVGAEYSGQRVRTFQRILGYLPVGDSVPGASSADFTPYTAAAYAELQARMSDIAFTAGLRYDQFSGRDDLPSRNASTQRGLSPRIAVSTVLRGATLVASFGTFRQAPDYQYLVDAAFDDTTRTGRSRQGNPDLGFEHSTQYEFSLRLRPRPEVGVRFNVFVRRLDQMVGSVPFGVDPDSSIFGNTDAGTVKGAELVLEREFKGGWGARVLYTLQDATAFSSNAFFLRRALQIDPITGDTTFPSKVEFPLDFDRRHALTAILTGSVAENGGPALLGGRPFAGLEGTAVVRVASGLPYSRTNATGDSIIGLPNSERLPMTMSVDMLLRRSFSFGRSGLAVYLDVRNVLNRRNIVALRRDTGTEGPPASTVQALAQAAYQAHPEPIPYESPRYRAWADLDNNGYVDGPAELQPLYLAAARDFTRPLFAYGAPRLFRLGVEVSF